MLLIQCPKAELSLSKVDSGILIYLLVETPEYLHLLQCNGGILFRCCSSSSKEQMVFCLFPFRMNKRQNLSAEYWPLCSWQASKLFEGNVSTYQLESSCKDDKKKIQDNLNSFWIYNSSFLQAEVQIWKTYFDPTYICMQKVKFIAWSVTAGAGDCSGLCIIEMSIQNT